MIKDALLGISHAAYAKARRRQDRITDVVTYLEFGSTRRTKVDESQILGPYSPGPKPELIGSNPPILHIGGNETVSVDGISLQRSGFLGRKATAQASIYPVEPPVRDGDLAVKESVYDRSKERAITTDVSVVFDIANHKTPEENLWDIAGTIRSQVWDTIKAGQIKRFSFTTADILPHPITTLSFLPNETGQETAPAVRELAD